MVPNALFMPRRRGHIWLSAVGSVVIGLGGHSAFGQLASTTWKGAANAGWGTAGNWSAGSIASGSTTAAVIDNSLGGGTPVILTTSPSVGGLTIASGFTLTRNSNTARTITVSASTAADTVFNNAGTISTGQSANTVTVTINYQAGTVVNSGTMEASAGTGLSLRSNATNNVLAITNTGGVLRTVDSGTLNFADINGGISVSGGSITNLAGLITHKRTSTLTNVAFTNGGLFESIAATSAANQQFNVVLAGSSTLSNSGTMTFTKDVTGTTPGQSSSLQISSSSASLTNSGSMYFATIGTATSGFVAGTTLQVAVSSTLTNNGAITFESRSDTNATGFILGANAVTTLAGSGTLALAIGTGGTASLVQIIGGSGSELVNGVGHTIRGAGALGANSLATLTNSGTIHADGTSALTALLRGGTSGLLTNSSAGVVRASGAGGLVFSGSTRFANEGLVQVDGGSLLSLGAAIFSTPGHLKVNGSLTANGPVSVAGMLSGTGSVAPAVTVAGILAPGNSIGTISTGALTLGGTSTFDVELGRDGTTPVSDRTVVSGGVTINNGANLAISLYTGLSNPVSGDIFFLIDNDGTDPVAGTFTKLNGAATTLTEGSQFPWNSQNWQITYQADVGGSSFTGGNDVAIMVVVPEPGALTLAALGLAISLVARRKNRALINHGD